MAVSVASQKPSRVIQRRALTEWLLLLFTRIVQRIFKRTHNRSSKSSPWFSGCIAGVPSIGKTFSESVTKPLTKQTHGP